RCSSRSASARTRPKRHISTTGGTRPRSRARSPTRRVSISAGTSGGWERAKDVTSADRLAATVAGLAFQNPIVLASGTAGYGVELADVMDLDGVGGLTTKAVSVEPRAGNPAPRVAELAEGMINSAGPAKPGPERTKATHVPW